MNSCISIKSCVDSGVNMQMQLQGTYSKPMEKEAER